MDQQQMTVIGVVENTKDRITFHVLKEILIMSNYKVYYKNKDESIMVLNKRNKNIIVMDIKPTTIKAIKDMGIDFNILIHTFLDIEDYEDEVLKMIFRCSENIIVNCDEDNWTALLEDNTKSIVITYGFNNKATINPSSYNIHELIEANICLQREIHTINNEIIEPFELPIRINSGDKLDIYSVLATIACGLLLEVDIFSVNRFEIFDRNRDEKLLI